MFFLMAADFIYRLFTKDLPPICSASTTAYYGAVLIGLAVILFFSPIKGFGVK